MDEFSSSTTTADLLKDINGDRVLSKFLDEVSKKSNRNRDEIALDTATLVATRMDFVSKSTMTEDEAKMEGISNVSEEDVVSVTKLFQEKYKLSDKQVEAIHAGLYTNINTASIERCEGRKDQYFSIGIKVCFLIVKILLIPVTGGISILM